jgi:hypothetical protein
VDDPFNFTELRVKQPAKLFAGRASYEIFGGRELVAVASEVDGRSVIDKIGQLLPDTRALAVNSPAGESIMTMTYHGGRWLVEVTDNDDALIGKIRIGGSRRHYTLIDNEDVEIAHVVGDMAVKRFTVTGTSRHPFAEVRKTYAGPFKESFTSADHYTVKFILTPTPAERILTVLFPVVLDLAKYGPT